jgi:hypothetical protein
MGKLFLFWRLPRTPSSAGQVQSAWRPVACTRCGCGRDTTLSKGRGVSANIKGGPRGRRPPGRISFRPETYRDNLSLTTRHVHNLVAKIQYGPIMNCGVAAERDHPEGKAKKAERQDGRSPGTGRSIRTPCCDSRAASQEPDELPEFSRF